MSLMMEAADAVKAEFRRSSATVELKCRGVEPVGDTGQIFRLDVGAYADFDWTWEGARAYKGTPWGRDQDEEDAAAQRQWSGDVVEVDKDAGLLFVHRDSAEPPRTGSFLVKPFGFLEALNAVYNGSARDHLAELLEERLPLALGEPPATPLEGSDPGLDSLAGVWRMPWGILWGPPGTGKTWTIGQQVAEHLAGGGERILVVSTTNKATDGVALAIGRALKQRGQAIEGVLRVGSGSNIRAFEREGLELMLKSSVAELRRQLADLIKRYEATGRAEERAELFRQIQAVRKELSEAAPFLDEGTRAIVCTAHHAAQQLATAEIAEACGENAAPFDTVIVDEAGLVSRAAAAALSCLGRRRFLLVGDPCQLAPISQMSRILPLQRGRWLAGSGLSHVSGDVRPPDNVHMLAEQRRMGPEIRELVSRYQYGGVLRDAALMAQGCFQREPPLDQTSPATWYVLDEENVPLAHVRAERGPGNRSWERRVTPRVLGKLISAHPGLEKCRVLYLSPFAAQVRRMKEYLADAGAQNWSSATVHSQQGAEADVVVFDTVNASSTAWPHDEWKRLINVALSRARHQVVLLASRDEMRQPYLRPLRGSLEPKRLQGVGGHLRWIDVEAEVTADAGAAVRAMGEGLGAQLDLRRAMRPILSHEQQQLCERQLDGKPRLVRGVAGSGKTVVLAHWVVQTLAKEEFRGRKIWVVHGNLALRGLLVELIEKAWQRRFPAIALPWEDVELKHVRDVLEGLMSEAGVRIPGGAAKYDYEGWAASYLHAMAGREIEPRCEALFIDEAQDLGHETLNLLTQIVEPNGDASSDRSVMIFYDNAQNVYARSTPRWKDFGLDMVGRSTVMKESFRSSRPITEFATNVYYRLEDSSGDDDLKELIRQHLVEPTERGGRTWLRIHYNQVDGPLPEFNRYGTERQELEAMAEQVRSWILDEGVRPKDIKVLCNQKRFRARVVEALEDALKASDVGVEEGKPQGFPDDPDVLLVNTAHGFKGYEAEIVVVPGVERFTARDVGALSSPLYVALTRARSLLWASGHANCRNHEGRRILDAMQSAWEDQRDRPAVAPATTAFEQRHDVVKRLGAEHGEWFDKLSRRTEIHEEPLTKADGSILAEPLFWVEHGGIRRACFGPKRPSTAIEDRLADEHVAILEPDEELWEATDADT